MYCEKCGKEIPEGTRFCESCGGKTQNNVMRYVSIILSALSVVLPFLSWLEVPVAKGLYSLFGMEQETPTFSLFGYIFAGNQYQNEKTFLVIAAIALVAFIGIIINVVYVIKSLKNTPKSFKYGTIGAVILTIVSFLFILIVGLTAAIFKIMKLTVMPYLTLAVSIANIVVIKKLKKQTA